MERSSIKLAFAAMLLTVMLAGCGAQGGDSTVSNNGQATNLTDGAAVSNPDRGGASQAPERTADMMGKIVKATDSTLVILESKTPPSAMRGGGGFGGGQNGNRPNGKNAAQGERPAAPADGGQKQPAAGAEGSTDQAQSGNQAGGSRRGMGGGRPGGFQMEFKDEQTTLSIHADTPIVSMSRGQEGMTMNQLKAADLKEGDIVTIWLDETDKTKVQYMTMFNMPANAGREGNK